jgi:hypothetical protein
VNENDSRVHFCRFRFASYIFDFLGRAGTCIRQIGHAKLRGGNRHCRRAKKTSATVVDFLRHDSSIPRAVSAITLLRTRPSAIRKHDQNGYSRSRFFHFCRGRQPHRKTERMTVLRDD